MQDTDYVSRKFRAVLTEVLPHELPIIFTNDFFYLSLIEKNVPPALAECLAELRALKRSDQRKYAKPYEYVIRKDRGGSTFLGLMHPNSQLDAAEFYNAFAETLIAACGISPASLRRPTSIASRTTANRLEDYVKRGEADVHGESEPDTKELRNIVSFFVYRDINLLSKFFDSSMYLSLEKKFSKLRTLDISKCFHSIYTHSVTWAVKNKDFSKENSSLFAFEQQFDRLMQRQNYNETNGIIIGPELSRLFAEVIFQRIDLNVIESAKKSKLNYGIDFEFKRYVDDYFVYANDTEIIDLIEQIIQEEAFKYKLHINEGKSDNFTRPFVTPLSSAKREIHRVMYELKDTVDELHGGLEAEKFRFITRRVKSKTLESRLIIGEHGIGFHNVSGWALSLLRVMIFDLAKSAKGLRDIKEDDDKCGYIERGLHALFSLVFYISSLDIRVTTTYSIGSILTVLTTKGFDKIRKRSDWIDHFVQKEMIDLLVASHSAFYRKMKRSDAVETFNLILLGSHYLGSNFYDRIEVRSVINDILGCDISYFSFITLKFVFLKDKSKFSNELSKLNSKAIDFVKMEKSKLSVDAESYLILSDLLSSPDLTNDEKRNIWSDVLPGSPSNAKLDFLKTRCGFVDWNGIRMTQLLMRRRLRPVYE
ncbi:hypothetical protein V473_08900 [Sphingobium cupriresistens LL01]|uniref:Reverse transcriptase domain-containing protein n=2 Tax=Sphingobium cupriresistens TaxID=1132417 RepID=A0A0J7Y602_9SPHN|nr:hypothetical protein V473_08900 [Sphingobium cupriresistens LL01]